MNNKLIRLVMFLSVCASTKVLALDNVYTVVGLGFSEVEVEDTSSRDFSYRFNIGYEFHSQWQAELGFQRLVDEEDSIETGLTADAITLSALGKAKSRSGELFYRIGIAYVDTTGQIDSNAQGSCDIGTSVVQQSVSLCAVDEGSVGGVLGLGFDFYVGLKSQVRLETEYLLGDNQFSAASVYIGYKFNF